MKLHKSLRLWTFYVDLEESLGTLDSTRAVYERILDLRIATPQIIINYALLLEVPTLLHSSYTLVSYLYFLWRLIYLFLRVDKFLLFDCFRNISILKTHSRCMKEAWRYLSTPTWKIYGWHISQNLWRDMGRLNWSVQGTYLSMLLKRYA